MNDAERVSASPWDFRMRGLVFGLIYGFGFFVGINLQVNIYHNFTPTYALLGARWGDAGVHAFAILAALFALAAFVIRVWGSSYLSSGIVWSEAVRTGQLRVSGPYRYVRNPLYLGNVLLALGVGLLGPPAATALIVLGNLLFVYRLIAIEERSLARVHGAAYEQYRRMVPRLWPRLTPAQLPSGEERPSLSDGLGGEIYIAAFALAMIYNAFFSWRSPNMAIMGLIFIAGFAIQIILRPFMRPRGQEVKS